MKKSFAIIGLGRFGLSIVEQLGTLTNEIIAIDVDETSVNKVSEYASQCIVCDSTKEDNLREIGIQNVDHAIVAIGNNVQATIMTTIVLKELGIKQITVRVDDELLIPVIYKIGATDVVLPEKSAAITLANKVVSDTILDYYHVSQDYGVAEIKISSAFKEISLVDLNSRNRFDVSVVVIKRNDEIIMPKGADLIEPNDKILVIGKNSKITKFDQFINN